MKINIVGIGAGRLDEITQRAKQAIAESQVIVGYTYYIELVQELTEGKEIVTNGMMGEIDRCKNAIEEALKGKTVSVISSGDAGVYGMASIVLELAEPYPQLEIEIIPGITAACSGGAVLGAPVAHDFAVISLSDLLTDWALIEKRIALAAQGDFVICLYNPSSKKRADYLQKACKIIMENTDNDLCCGIVRNIGRDGQESKLMRLCELKDYKADMFTTVFIGNSKTKEINGRLVTPRGYLV